jgi:ribose transport system substrate-binding protein
MFGKRLFLLAVLASLGFLTGCGDGEKSAGTKPASTPTPAPTSNRPKVGIVTNCTHEFWSICEAGAKKGEQEFGVEVIFKQPPNNTVPDQMEIVNALLKQDVKGLAVSVINPQEQTRDLKRIGGQVSLITMDNDAVDTGRLCYIGIENYSAGKAVGRMMKKALPNGGTVALFIGNTTSANAKDRVAGVLDELSGTDNRKAIADGKFQAAYGKYTLYKGKIFEDETKEDVAQNNAKDVLEQLKDTPNVGLIGLYAYNPKAILAAARSKQLVGKVKIVGFDEDVVTLDGVAKGEIEGTVVQDPFNYGYESVKWLALLAKGGDKSQLPKTPTPYSVIVKEAKDGETESLGGVTYSIYAAAAYQKKLKDAIDSVKK